MSCHIVRKFLSTIVFFASAGWGVADEIVAPQVLDANLQLSLLASEPEIVTPVALATDLHGRLYAIETHTHARDSNYKGPSHDRILVFEDSDGDGQLDKSRVVADGLRNALSIAFSSDESLYVLQMKSLLILRDKDQDGRYETHDTIVKIETDNNNHHGVLLAMALDQRDRIHVSLGNIGGNAYSIHGADGSNLSGQGDSGLIFRCDRDGSSLERFAVGFWNPCDLTFDAAGRLLASDNDPDARGPNRILHVIEGGEYGYKSRFGNSGLHPYCSWNGELPGTLPMLAGVGEAPVGLLDCAATSLPGDYASDLLVCVWGTNQVVRVRTRQRGASITGHVEPLIMGNENFRPTGIVATSDGTVYIADWADRRYPVHGKGRIWKLACKSNARSLSPSPPFSAVPDDADSLRLNRLREASTKDSFDELLEAATKSDPFPAAAAVTSLSRPVFRDVVTSLLDSPRPEHRLVALLTLRKANVSLDASRLRQLLQDEDAAIRQMVMIWLGETMRMDLASDVQQSMPLQTGSASLFETFLATSQLLTDEECERIKLKTPGNQIDRRVDQQLVRAVLADDQLPPSARGMAVRYLTAVDDAKANELLSRLARSNDPALASEAIRTLGTSPSPSSSRLLASIANDEDANISVRCDAIMSLADSDSTAIATLVPLLADFDSMVSLTAAQVDDRADTTGTGSSGFLESIEIGRVPTIIRRSSRPTPLCTQAFSRGATTQDRRRMDKSSIGWQCRCGSTRVL